MHEISAATGSKREQFPSEWCVQGPVILVSRRHRHHLPPTQRPFARWLRLKATQAVQKGGF